MSKQVANAFTSYEFTDAEAPSAMAFSELQEQYLRTELAAVAADKLSILPSSDVTAFYLQHEYCRGKMDILTGLLSVSQDTKSDINAAIQHQLDLNKGV